jgi:predicted PurR-regulated permease PerM
VTPTSDHLPIDASGERWPGLVTTLRALKVPIWLVRVAIVVFCLGIIAVAAAALIWFALRVQFISIAILIGFAEVSLLWPLVKWLRARGVPQVLAAIMCVVAFLSFFAAIMLLVVTQVISVSDNLADQVVGALEDVLAWVRDGPFGVDDVYVQDVLDNLQDNLTSFVTNIASTVATGFGVVANLVTIVLIATFFAIFALASGDKLWAQFMRTLPATQKRPATSAFRSAMRTTGAWFYASVVTGLVDGFLIGLGLWILGVPLAVAIGALTFLMAFIPLVGATIAGAVAVAVAFFTGGLSAGIWALIIVLIVQQLEGNVLSPLLMARAVSFHPLVILVMTTTAATMFGMAGLFLAVPVAGAVVAAIIGYRRHTAEAEASHAEANLPGAVVPDPVTEVNAS